MGEYFRKTVAENSNNLSHHAFVTAYGNGRGQSNAYIDEGKAKDVGMDIFRRGLCLPSDNKMTEGQQDRIQYRLAEAPRVVS